MSLLYPQQSGAAAASPTPGLCNGRLTTESGVPVSTADRMGQSTIYFTPYLGNQVALFDGAVWTAHTFTERSLALSGLTSGKNYDVFIYDNVGTLTLELSAAWTSDTVRATALAMQDSVYVKSGATTRRYLGTIRTTGTTTTEDSAAKRFIWNAQNQVVRSLLKSELTDHAYASATYRYVNNSSANKIEFVVGQAGAVTRGLRVNTDSLAHILIALDWAGSSFNDATDPGAFYSGGSIRFPAPLTDNVSAGYHFLALIEAAFASPTIYEVHGHGWLMG